MWQIICLCLPATTRDERQRLFSLFSQVLQSYERMPDETDLGLFFLRTLTPEESLTVLEARLDLVVRSQEMLEMHMENSPQDVMQVMIDDHIYTLLAAERTWLVRTIERLRIIVPMRSKLL